MRIDLEYMAKLLEVFLESDKAHIVISDFEKSGIYISNGDVFSEEFIFHVQIAIDNELIGTIDGSAVNLSNIGVRKYLSGRGMMIDVPIRLTQKGHDLACSLNTKEVLNRLKSEFKNAPFQVIFDGGQQLLQHFLKKKLDGLLN